VPMHCSMAIAPVSLQARLSQGSSHTMSRNRHGVSQFAMILWLKSSDEIGRRVEILPSEWIGRLSLPALVQMRAE
jgi:hypothetical protein